VEPLALAGNCDWIALLTWLYSGMANVSDTYTATAARAAALAQAALALDPRAVYRVLAHWSQAQRKRHQLTCPVCARTVPDAHDLARYCSPQCARRAAYLRKRDRRDLARSALRGEFEPLPTPSSRPVHARH
jgi:hypothetical protein